VAIVSHCDPLRAVVAAWLGMPLDHLLRFDLDPASVSVAEAGDWGVRVRCLNETGDVPL
jgi:broad specificity phosphatase PhoE